MFFTFFALALAGCLFLGALSLIELGRLAGLRRVEDDGASARVGLGAIDATVFSLLGLLIAFTFSGAAVRFDNRRQLSIQEANAIGTAWLRLDVLPPAAQGPLREDFHLYVDARLDVARAMPDLAAVQSYLQRCSDLQTRIWANSVAACAESTPQTTMLVLPALNQMFDIAAARTAAARMHVPHIILISLFALALASAFMAGHGMAQTRKRSWIHSVGFSAAVSMAVFVIVDLEYPRVGLIRIDATDQLLVDVRQSMEKPQ